MLALIRVPAPSGIPPMKAQSSRAWVFRVQGYTLIRFQAFWWLSDVVVVLVADALVVIHCCGCCSGCVDVF